MEKRSNLDFTKKYGQLETGKATLSSNDQKSNLNKNSSVPIKNEKFSNKKFENSNLIFAGKYNNKIVPIKETVINTDKSGLMDLKTFNNKKSNWGIIDEDIVDNKNKRFIVNDPNIELVQNFNQMGLDIDNPMFPRNNRVTKLANIVNDKLIGYEIATEGIQTNTKKFLSSDEERQVKEVFLNGINLNKMTLGTKIMMENEKTHALEAIESGIYVTWQSSKNTNLYTNKTECFRIGSKSMCICGHVFTEHEKIINKKYSTKCEICVCKNFNFIPQLPEEVGEYWLPKRKDFKYLEWKAKCKCKHSWESHSVNKKLKCKECNCSNFYSAFCCVVCNGFWHEHESVYELKEERILSKKPVDQDFLPLNEAQDIQDAVYKNINKTKPKQLK